MIFAHDIGAVSDLPVPAGIFVSGTGLLLVAVFVTLAIRKTEPRFQVGPDYSGPGLRAPVGPPLSILGLLGLLLVIGQLVGLVVTVDIAQPRPTIAPVTLWVLLVLVVPICSVFIGNWYTALSPWRTLGSIIGSDRRSRPGLGVWPATTGLLALGWLQLISVDPSDPIVLGTAALVYTVYLLSMTAAIGVDSGLGSFDVFTVYNRLVSSIAPVGRNSSGRLVWRGWLRALPALPAWPGLWLFISAMVGIVLYDGLRELDWFPDAGSSAMETLLLFGVVAALAVALRLAAPGGNAQGYAHTLVPLAIALAFAHYFTLIIFEGQLLFSTISDPFGLGWDLFGTADRSIVYFAVPDAVVWYIQLSSIVLGAVVGVVLFHDRALAHDGTGAHRSQYAMLALMIGLTSMSLLALAG